MSLLVAGAAPWRRQWWWACFLGAKLRPAKKGCCYSTLGPQATVTASRAALMQLRAETGISLALCKAALESANYDLDMARGVLKGMIHSQAARVEAKNSQEGGPESLREGIAAVFDLDANQRVVFKLLCKSDFVARSPRFASLASEVFKAHSSPVATPAADQDAALQAAIGALMEPIRLEGLRRIQKAPSQLFGAYLHQRLSKSLAPIAALVVLDPGQCEARQAQDLADGLAKHVVASSPATLDELLTQPYLFSESGEELVATVQAKWGVRICDFSRLSIK